MKQLKGYRARIQDVPALDGSPGEHLYLCISRGPNGPFISNQPEPPKPVTRAVALAMMKEWQDLGYEPYRLTKVFVL